MPPGVENQKVSGDFFPDSRLTVLDRLPNTAIAIILIAYGFVRSIAAAATTPFWYDEICTQLIVRQRTASAMYGALKRGADSNPPIFYLIERLAISAVGNEHIALRLPSAFAFAVALLCFFWVLRTRFGGFTALLCSTVLLMTTVYEPYAAEGRPYALLLACIAFALLCYQRTPDIRWTCLMALSLALAEAVHYYAIFSIAPFLAAEGFLLLRTRRIRLGVWLALLCSFLPLAIFWPLLANFRAYFGSHPWAPPSLSSTLPIYGWFFHVPTTIGLGTAAVASVVILLVLVWPQSSTNGQATAPPHEFVLALALLAVPFIGFVGAKVGHGMMFNRYALAGVFGILIACAQLLKLTGRRGTFLFAVFVFCVAAFQERSFWATRRGHLTTVHSPVEDLERALSGLGQYDDLPVVISDGLDYLPIAYYASPEQARRFVTLADPAGAVEYLGNDSVDRAMLIQRSYMPLQVYEFSEFAARHRAFLLYSSGSSFDWWPARLIREGHSLRTVLIAGGARIYFVELGKIPDPER